VHQRKTLTETSSDLFVERGARADIHDVSNSRSDQILALPAIRCQRGGPLEPAAPTACCAPALKPLSSGAVSVLAPAPMLAQLDSRLPVGDKWRYEPKLDGFRGLLWRRASGQVQLLSRNARDLGPWFPELVGAARALEPGTLLDGEMVTCDESGWADFGSLQERLSTARSGIAGLAR
jgi:ATP-dependent DNA ligase